MKTSKAFRYASSAIAMLIFSGCAGSQTPQVSSRTASGTTVTPASSSGGSLLYATGYSNSSGAQTFMLTYPQGKLVGSISGPSQGLCSDAKGNVYLLWRNSVTEYAHGSTTPIKTLRVPGADLYGCAVDPTSNNLAVTFFCPPCGYQNLAIWTNGSGTPARYQAPAGYAATYDDQGNLFLANYTGNGIAELPVGSQTFTNITLNKSLGDVGSLQWDGSYVTLETVQTPLIIYRIAVSGSSGTIVGQTKIGRYMRRIGYSWISPSDGSFVVPFSSHGSQTHTLGIWGYPKAGRAINIINKIGAGDYGFGYVTVSVAPSR